MSRYPISKMTSEAFEEKTHVWPPTFQSSPTNLYTPLTEHPNSDIRNHDIKYLYVFTLKKIKDKLQSMQGLVCENLLLLGK